MGLFKEFYHYEPLTLKYRSVDGQMKQKKGNLFYIYFCN